MRANPQGRRGLTLFQLLVVMVVVVILVAFFLTAVPRLRQAAVRNQSVNNIRQLMIAIHNYQSTYNAIPPGVNDNHFSASALLLPYIEQDAVYRTIDFKKSIDDEANAAARKLHIKVFESPQDPVGQVSPDWGATNYLYNDLIFSANPKFNLANVPDGTSNTIGIGETLKGDGRTRAETVQRQHVRLDKDKLKGLKPDDGVEYFRRSRAGKDSKHIAGDRCESWMDGRFLMGTFNGRLQPNDPRPDVSCAGAGGA
jgi:type II secretory pathway pseudopilin PulG